MKIKKLTQAFVAALFIATGVNPLSHAATTAIAQTKPVPSIAEDYLASADFNPHQLFNAKGVRNFSISLPQLGKLELVYEDTKTIDSAGKILRWQGHLQGRKDLTVQFVRGLSGNVTGMVNTPQGRILLGSANGQYFFHGEAADVAPQATLAHLPAVLNAVAETAAASDHDHAAPASTPDEKLVAYPVEFNIAGLANLTQGQDAQISLPGTGDFVVHNDGTQPGDLSGATFVGHLKDFGDDFRVVVSYSPSGAQGSILTPYGEFQLQTLGSKQWLVDITRSKLEQHKSEEADSVTPPAIGAGAVSTAQGNVAAGTTSTGGSTTTPTVAATTVNGKTQIDVLVLYTPGLETRLGGNSQALTRIQLLAALANQAYIDSNVQISLRVVGTVKINMADNTANSQELSNMQSATGSFTDIRNLRQTYGADLVTLVRPFYMNGQGGNCGVGYISGYGGTNVASYAGYGYSVVSDGSDVGGQPYYCNNYTFTHELGHNMGSMHDRATVQSQGGGTGAYPYSFGYGVSGTFGTIMSYINPVVGKFSSPNLTCSNSNLPCGVAAADSANSADNAQSLNNTKDLISGFVASNNTLPVTISGVVTLNGNALANVSVTPSVTGATCSNSGSNGVYSCTVNAGWSGALTPALSGYSFTPGNLSFSNVQASVANQNFSAASVATPVVTAPQPITIRGRVLVQGQGLAGVRIVPSTKGVACSNTDNHGDYSCTVPKSWSGALTASATSYRFAPATYVFNKVQVSLVSKNFTGFLVTVKITGTVRAKGKPLAGVTMAISSVKASCTPTNGGGAFTCTVPQGLTVSVTPSLTGYRFTPSNYKFSALDYTVTGLQYDASK